MLDFLLGFFVKSKWMTCLLKQGEQCRWSSQTLTRRKQQPHCHHHHHRRRSRHHHQASHPLSFPRPQQKKILTSAGVYRTFSSSSSSSLSLFCSRFPAHATQNHRCLAHCSLTGSLHLNHTKVMTNEFQTVYADAPYIAPLQCLP